MLSTQPGPNIVLIVIDALRARDVGCYGSPGGRSPNIDRLAGDGFLFEDAYCCWNTTDPSLTSMLTGKYPISHGITQHGDKIEAEHLRVFRETGTRTLAEILREKGYATLAVDWMGRWFKRGFDRYGYQTPRGRVQRVRHGLVDAPANVLKYVLAHYSILRCYDQVRTVNASRAIRDLKGVLDTFWFTKELAQIQDAARVTDAAASLIDGVAGQSFFLFLHYWDTHTPYHCAKGDRTYGGSDPREILKDRYRGAIRCVDRELGRLFSRLRERGLWENTVVIVTSDHGESLTERDILFDHHGLYDVTTHVPLVIHFPRMPARPGRFGGFVQHVDLLPTLLDLLGGDPPGAELDGSSLVGLMQGTAPGRPFVFVEESYVQRKRAVRDHRYKYIAAPEGETGVCRYCHKVHGGREELYDLEADPDEATNVVRDLPQVAAQMRETLESCVRALLCKREERRAAGAAGGGGMVQGEADREAREADEIARRLRALGYR